MILMKVSLDNILGFRNFSTDFSYPKKLVRSTLRNEHLAGNPNFRFKKVVIIMGGNATGKTTLGKALMAIFNFIAKKDANLLVSSVNDKGRPASFSLEYVSGNELFRVDAQIVLGNVLHMENSIQTSVRKRKIGAKDSFETCSGALAAQEEKREPHLSALDKAAGLSWRFTFPDSGAGSRIQNIEDADRLADILDSVMRTFDPSISHVLKSKELDGSYIIKHGGHEIIIKDGRLLNGDILSSGTMSGLGISFLLSAMIGHQDKFYYCDETRSVQSDLEKNLLAIMISKLGEDEQLFFTTHNTSVLDMNLPKHSFLFLRKENGEISAISADSLLKRNTDNLRRAVENDLFSIAPDASLLRRLEAL